MNIEAQWYNDRKTAVLLTIYAFLPEWAEFDAGADQAIELARSVSHEMIIIVDPQGFSMPKEDTPLPHLRRAVNRLPKNVKFIVGVINGLGFFERSIVDVVANISFRNRLKLVNNRQEALKLVP